MASTSTTKSRAASTTTTSAPTTTPAASSTPGLAGERSTKEGVGPESRSRGRSLVGGQSAVLGEGDDRLKRLPSEGSHTDALLSRQSLGLGGEEGRGKISFGRSSVCGDLLSAKGGGGERHIRGGHSERRLGRRGRGRGQGRRRVRM